MKKGGHWVMYTYESGSIGEKLKFYVPDGKPSERITRKERSALKKLEQQLRSAQRILARVINANFHNGDYLIGLDYSQKGLEQIISWGRKNGLPVDSTDPEEQRDAIWESAAHEMENCLRRVKREMEKDGVELKYVAITSDMNPETKEQVRVHHHLVVNAEAKEAFLKKWAKMGNVEYEGLWTNQRDRTWIAEYFLNQVRRIPDAKKFRCSRNLHRPQPKKRVCMTDAEIRFPKNSKPLSRSEFIPGQLQYIRYELPPSRVRPPLGTV